MKLKCDEPLSNFAFKFNLRRYIAGTDQLAHLTTLQQSLPDPRVMARASDAYMERMKTNKVGRCRCRLNR